MNLIRLVTFDALHTIITPRYPIYVQYSQVFAPYVGILPPDAIKRSFKVALKSVQIERPSYEKGAENWWGDVIRKTALAAGANEQALEASLPEIVKKLMTRFSSKEGYKAFDDAIPTIGHLHKRFGIRTAVVSNGDTRIRAVLKDLEFPIVLEPIVLSEEEGIEKPSRDIFMRVLDLVNQRKSLNEKLIHPEECLHVGDELSCDYRGATDAGMKALLLRRPGADGDQEHKDEGEDLQGVNVVNSLDAIIPWLQESGIAERVVH